MMHEHAKQQLEKAATSDTPHFLVRPKNSDSPQLMLDQHELIKQAVANKTVDQLWSQPK